MALSIIIIFISLILLVLFVLMLLSHLDVKHRTNGESANIMEKPIVAKSVEQILKDVLKDPPTGCMWEVKKTIKHYRKLANGGNVFDGSIDNVFAEIRLITPFGNGRVFSLPVDHDFLEHQIKYNAQISINEYTKRLAEIESYKKQINDGWDGVYS